MKVGSSSSYKIFHGQASFASILERKDRANVNRKQNPTSNYRGLISVIQSSLIAWRILSKCIGAHYKINVMCVPSCLHSSELKLVKLQDPITCSRNTRNYMFVQVVSSLVLS
ncbi:hypothetical protein NPIL_531001 [Nephila pilipes]|uniref:Uncharacterized protein n=1 Tax=Nephila pilipes TaxID=299642 RepID=A0A8X6NKE0_NEPPI|nr:hypothetical protein NPIL_531001 [Nephila pilipes]